MSLRHGCAALLVLAASVAHAQQTPTFQSGGALPNAVVKVVTSGRLGSAGDLNGDTAGRGVNPFAIQDNLALGLCSNTAAVGSARNSLCIGHDADGNGLISLDSYAGLGNKALIFRVNGVMTPFASGIGMNANASNATLPDALTNLTAAALVPDNATLLAKSTTTYPRGVWRADFAAAFGAPPLFYMPSNSACSLNSGNGDNGSQVKSADNKCWLAVFPDGVYNVLQFGADPTNATDSYTAVQNAVNAANGGSVYFPIGQFKICTEVTSNKAVHIRGGGTGIGPGVWTTDNASVISVCGTTQNGFVITSNNSSTFENFWIRLAPGVGPATAGDMIKLTYTTTTGHVSGPVFSNLAIGHSSFSGTKTIWNGIHIVRPEWPIVEKVRCQGWVNHCIVYETTAAVEGSGGWISHSHFFGDPTDSSQASPIYSEVGYIDVHDNEILAGNIGINFSIKNNPAGFIKIHDNTIENSRNYGISVSTQDGSAVSHLMIQNNEFSNVSYATGLTASIVVNEYPGGGSSTAYIADVQITGNVLRNSMAAGRKYIWVQTGKNITVAHNQIEELGANNPFGIQVAGSTSHAGLAAPIMVADNEILGTTNKYAINATQLVTLRDQFGLAFAGIPTGAANGSSIFISNADPGTAPCTAAGAMTGAMAFRQNGAWKCF